MHQLLGVLILCNANTSQIVTVLDGLLTGREVQRLVPATLGVKDGAQMRKLLAEKASRRQVH